jgi:hypothetical protein
MLNIFDELFQIQILDVYYTLIVLNVNTTIGY